MISINKLANLLPPEQEKAVNACLPREVRIALNQDERSRMRAVVSVGESVSEGQVLAVDEEGLCNVHASVPGVVKRFVEMPLPNGKTGLAIAVKLSGSFTYLGKIPQIGEWSRFPREQLLRALAEKGVVNTFKDAVPLAAEIGAKLRAEKPYNLVARLFDDDPTHCTDSFVAKHCLREVLEGLSVVATVVRPAAVYCLYDKRLDISEVKVAASSFFSVPFNFIAVDTAKYPSGFRQGIVRQINREMQGRLQPPATLHDLMLDAVTAFSVYEAAALNMPAITRFVSVCGDAPGFQRVFRARLGMPIFSLLQECGGLVEKPGKIIINGSICGNAVHDFSVPVMKATKSVTVLKSRAALGALGGECIRCGRCRKSCPSDLHPDFLYQSFRRGLVSEGEKLAAILCAECRLCNMVCPARLPLCQAVAQIKTSAGTEDAHEK